MKKKFLSKIFLIFLLIIIFAYLCFSDNGLIDFIKNPSRLNLNWLLFGFLCQIANIIIDAILTHKFLSNINPKISFKNALICGLIGQFYCAVTPSASGGQPMQIYAMSQRNIKAGITTSALVQKFLIYQISLVIYFATIIILKTDYISSLNPAVHLILIVGFLIQVLCMVVLIVFSLNKSSTEKIINVFYKLLNKLKFIKNSEEKIQKIQHHVNLFHQSNSYLLKSKKFVLEVFILTFIQLTFIFLIPYCVYKSFSLPNHPIIDLISAQTFVTMASSFFPIPGASGAAEGASSIFLSPYFGETTIKSAIVVCRIINYYFTIIATAPFAKLTKQTKKNPSL